MAEQQLPLGISPLNKGEMSTARATASSSTLLYIREGRSAQRDLAVFNIAANPPLYKGAIEKITAIPKNTNLDLNPISTPASFQAVLNYFVKKP